MPDDLLLNSAQAARKLGVSPKALRLYERHGLLRPRRSEAGWRYYGDDEMAKARDIVALRGLGMSLADVGRALAGERAGLEAILAGHQAELDRQMGEAARRLEALSRLRGSMAEGRIALSQALASLSSTSEPEITFDLPWPWAGERFVLSRLMPVTFLTGPLGSGKTRLALKLAESIAGAQFSGLNRLDDDAVAARTRLAGGPELRARVEAALAWLLDDGATESPALLAALIALCDPQAGAVVMDLVEHGLDEASQDALGAWLRRYGDAARPLIIMTRSSAILDLESSGPEAIVLYCPANHSPPIRVLPVPGAAGYEALASCLAPPEVRQRVAGMTAVMA